MAELMMTDADLAGLVPGMGIDIGLVRMQQGLRQDE